MKKGPRSGYAAETGEESAGSESSLGEPYEQPSPYRIRPTQEAISFCVKAAAGEIVEGAMSTPSARRPPSPLDFYLSWMSPHFHSIAGEPPLPLWQRAVNDEAVLCSDEDLAVSRD